MASRAHAIALGQLAESVGELRAQLRHALDRIEKLEQDAAASSETRRGADAARSATTAKRPAPRKRKAA